MEKKQDSRLAYVCHSKLLYGVRNLLKCVYLLYWNYRPSKRLILWTNVKRPAFASESNHLGR